MDDDMDMNDQYSGFEGNPTSESMPTTPYHYDPATGLPILEPERKML